MWNPDGHRLPSWVEDVYEVLAPEIREHGDGIPCDDAKAVLTDRKELELTPTEATHAVDQLLDRGYLEHNPPISRKHLISEVRRPAISRHEVVAAYVEHIYEVLKEYSFLYWSDSPQY